MGLVVSCILQPSCLGFLLDSDFSRVPINLRVVVLEPRQSENNILRSYVGDQESNKDGDVLEFHLDPGVMRNFSGLVKGPVNVAGYDRSVEFVDFDIVFLGIGLVHEYSSCSGVEEDRGFDSFMSFSGLAFNGQGNMD